MMRKKIRIVKILMIAFLSLFLVSCKFEDNKDDIIQEFSKFERNNNVVAILDGDYFYFDKNTLIISELDTIGEYENCYLIYLDSIYFQTTKKNNDSTYIINIYKCDSNGDNIELVFSHDNYKIKPKFKSVGCYFLWLYYEPSIKSSDSQAIDSFDVTSLEHQNIEKGKNCDLENYREEFHGYITTQKDNSFQIYVRNSNTNYIINDELLRECGYYESLNRFDFSTEGVQIYDDKIFLCYRLHRSDSGLEFCFAIFEYNTDSNNVLLRSVIFMGDIETIKICEFIKN